MDSLMVPINMRVPPNKARLIDAGVHVTGVSRTSFIVEAACAKAEEVILNHRHFVLDNVAFDAFEKALETKVTIPVMSRPKRWS